jgi:polyhydroxyalkanoate synthesis repressor PhaR
LRYPLVEATIYWPLVLARTGIFRKRVGQHERGARMSDPRVIKKYPNRRLYDTVESRYITLADVRRLVVERIDFVVVDKKNNADITRSILLQVIAEQEHLPEPMLTQDFMVSVIRSYGGNLQASVSGHLEQTLKQFLAQNHQSRDRAKAFGASEPPRPRPAEEGFKALSAVRIREGEKERDESNLTK